MEVNFINKVSSRQLLLVLRLAQIRMFIYMLFLDEEASYQVWAVLLQYQSSYELSTKLNLLSKTASLSSHSFPHSFLEFSRWIYTMHLCSAYSYLKRKAFQVYVSCSCSLFLFKKDNSILKEEEKRVKPHFRRNKTSNYWQYESDDKAINYQQFFLLVSYTHT